MNRLVGAVAIGIVTTIPLHAGIISSGPPVAEQLSVDSGQVGQTVLIMGRNLGGTDVLVRFGDAPAAAGNTGRNRQVITAEVPGRDDPREPDTVPVTVFVNGQEAEYPNGPLQFTYDIPRPYPVIEDYGTGDPQSPKSVLLAHPFEIHFSGIHFTTGHRAPVTCLAIGPTTEKAIGLAGEATDTDLAFKFPGLQSTGSYQFLVGFSDASAAAIDAPQFVYRVFGSPPVIQQVDAASTTESVSCDFTKIVELGVCGFTGMSDVRALPPGVFIEGSYTALRMSALITDPDSIPGRSDILLATVSYTAPIPQVPPTEISLLLLDDGSSVTHMSQQQGGWLEDCSDATPDACACRPLDFALNSGDVASGDDRYTRDLALVNPTTNSILLDCIAQQSPRTQILLAHDESIAFKFEAVDREGNLTTWPTQPAFTGGTDTVTCAGDPCGCCLLLSPDPASPPPTGCSGLEGLPSSALPGGFCRSF